VNLWLALRRLLPLLAVLSLALTPAAAPAATTGMHASMAHGHHAAALATTAAPGWTMPMWGITTLRPPT
jgi:hypothetical protein